MARAKVSFARLWLYTLVMYWSLALARDCSDCTTSTLSVMPEVKRSLERARFSFAKATFFWATSTCTLVALRLRKLRCQAVNVSEVESLSMVCDDNRNFVARPATTTDLYFCFSAFLVSVHDSVCQSFAERDFDAVFLAGNALRPFDQKHQTIDQWRDSLNLAGHP